ncbi:MAG TPA: hypothetical protein VG963_01295 [Polyangiaceae bacterium]|nr:hypothetical protein [Polyangiaceae bacterium]
MSLLRSSAARLSLPVTVALVFALAVVFQEKITVGHGLGWDGVRYAKWAKNFGPVLRKGVDAYYAQRLLPSAVAYGSLVLFGVKTKAPMIIRAFEIWSVVLVALSAWSYDVAARSLRVSTQTRWLGAIGLFGSFAILKFAAFDPVLTDVWGFAFGMFQLQFCLTRRHLPLALISVLGAFAWPTLLPVGACLLFFPAVAEPCEPAPVRMPWHVHDLLAAALVGVWIWLCWPMARDGHTLRNSTGDIDLRFVRLSVAVSAAYLFAGARELLADRRLLEPRMYLRAAWSLPGALAVATFVGAVALRSKVTSAAALYGLHETIEMTVFSAIKEPGIFALAHVLYWGPLVLLMFLGWRRVVGAIHRAGPGVTGVALVGLVLALNGESRKLVSFAPLFYVFLLPALDQLAISARQAWFLALASLLFSRVWITFDGNMVGDLQQMPAQMLYMVMGPWITPEMYLLQLLIVLVLAVYLANALFRSDRGHF